MKLLNRVLGLPTFKEENGITYKLCTKCLNYYPMTTEYFPKRSNVKCGFDSHCKNCGKEKEKRRIRVVPFNENGDLYCTRCKTYKPLSEFYANSSKIKNRNFYSSNCKQCESERKRIAKKKENTKLSVEDFLKSLMAGCKTRALKDNKFKFDLTIDQLLDLWNKQNGKCAISGLQMTTIRGVGRLILNASIDRIIPGGDYTINNVQLVCSHVNTMRLNLSVEELTEFCKNIVNYQETLIKHKEGGIL